MMSFAAFEGEAHRPFWLEGGEAAVLLIHGFPGTPAEMRPLGEALHAAGWTAQGLLLPGFGADIETLPRRTCDDWIESACAATRALRQRHRSVAVIGFSMGGAVALSAAARVQPDALVLLNPLTRMSHALWRLLPLITRLFPQVKPFNLIKLDFENSQTRESIAQFMPGADLDDPQVRDAIRDFSVPTRMFEQLRQVGEQAFRVAPKVYVRTLVVQGLRDQTISPEMTRKLAARLPICEYAEIDAEHNFTIPKQSGWDHVLNLVLRFIEESVATFD